MPACFLSALVISLLAHIFARIFKAPVTVFLIAGILPTVPERACTEQSIILLQMTGHGHPII